MKKLLLSLSLFLALGAYAGKAQAQISPRFGIRGGLNIANLNDVDNTDSRTGFMAGLYANFPINYSPVSIQPEVLYSQKGAKTSTLTGQGTEATVKLDYIEIPVLAKFAFVNDGNITPNVYFGPYVGFKINTEAKVSGSDGSLSTDIDDQVKGTDFGVVVGAGVDINRFNVGVRYGAGLTDTFKNGDGKNGVFSIVAGIGF